MIDDRSYTPHLISCKIKAWKMIINHFSSVEKLKPDKNSGLNGIQKSKFKMSIRIQNVSVDENYALCYSHR